MASAKQIIKDISLKRSSTKYSHSNRVDPARGSYEVDCTGFVNHILFTQNLIAQLDEIQNFIDTQDNIKKPIFHDPWPSHYVLFLSSIGPKQFWIRIDNAKNLMPGDLIVYSSNKKDLSSEYGQHIMIVSESIKPGRQSSHIWVPIFDSTKIPHGKKDKRTKDGGIGQGTIGLQLDDLGSPTSLEWSPESKSKLTRNIKMIRVRG